MTGGVLGVQDVVNVHLRSAREASAATTPTKAIRQSEFSPGTSNWIRQNLACVGAYVLSSWKQATGPERDYLA